MERNRVDGMDDAVPEDELDDKPKETEIDRRAEPKAVHEVNPYPPRERGTAVYGDTDLDPNRDDQASAHRADPDEHL